MNSMPLRALVFAALVAASAAAAVKNIRVEERSDVVGDLSFGPAGPYERIVAKVNFAVDPNLAANRIITDIDLAPRNEEGLVEFSADLYVLKPRDPARGNGTILFEVSNRGRKYLLGTFNRAPSSLTPSAEADFGDKFLLERGFTLVWLGWQFDLPDEPELMRFYTPVATQNGRVITGLVRSEFAPDAKSQTFSLADRDHRAYPAADLNDPAARLTVRESCRAARREVPRRQWRFARLENGKPAPDPTSVYLATGFEPGKIYEMIYTSQNPPLVGLGPAAVRDFISYLKYGGPASAINILGDQRRFLKRAIGFGSSQSGRFLRTFLYYGFNQDEEKRMVFDGVWAHVAGGGRGSFNHRFAQPSRDGHPHMNCFYPTDIFPFSDLPQTDPASGQTGGLLERAMAANVVPKIFYTNGSYEYWGRSAALLHVTPDGGQDAPLAENTRIYLLAGTQHGAGTFPPTKGDTLHLRNPNDYRWLMRALLAAMNDWLAGGKQPPASRYPMLARGELAAPGTVKFPALAGVTLPKFPQRAWRTDYGPEFLTKGIVANEPPKLGEPFPVLVPQVDADGNETSGIRPPLLEVPLATYSGWNLRDPRLGAPEQMYSMAGSYFPFARTKAERETTRDPRPSIEERYKSREAYLSRFRAAAEKLAAEGYLLVNDVGRIVEAGARQWDHAAEPR